RLHCFEFSRVTQQLSEALVSGVVSLSMASGLGLELVYLDQLLGTLLGLLGDEVLDEVFLVSDLTEALIVSSLSDERGSHAYSNRHSIECASDSVSSRVD